jgi:hypothetical protein
MMDRKTEVAEKLDRITVIAPASVILRHGPCWCRDLTREDGVL